MRQSNSRVSIVGAGPGDPELLTIKAWRTIKSADVILYDALVSEEILNLASESATKIYVGKRSSNHAYSQDDINEMIVAQALIYGHAVRLKGGDPFVFGRGGEEMVYARNAGLEVEIVPGISSSIGVPGNVGIPVTHRGLSESFWVLTATDKNGNIANDIKIAAATNATLIVLMGLNKLEQIVKLYLDQGKQNLPLAIVQNGTLKNQKVVVGTIADIGQKVKMERLVTPAVIIIGEVVNLYESVELKHFTQNIFA